MYFLINYSFTLYELASVRFPLNEHVCVPRRCLCLCSDSCQLGWRLLTLLTSYCHCSDALGPYLTTFLEQTADDERRANYSQYRLHVAYYIHQYALSRWKNWSFA